MARNSDIRCSFCNKSQEQVRKLIAGPAGVYICDECVDVCREVMKELLNADTTVTLFNLNKDVITYKVKDLLPYGFDKGDLNE